MCWLVVFPQSMAQSTLTPRGERAAKRSLAAQEARLPSKVGESQLPGGCRSVKEGRSPAILSSTTSADFSKLLSSHSISCPDSPRSMGGHEATVVTSMTSIFPPRLPLHRMYKGNQPTRSVLDHPEMPIYSGFSRDKIFHPAFDDAMKTAREKKARKKLMADLTLLHRHDIHNHLLDLYEAVKSAKAIPSPRGTTTDVALTPRDLPKADTETASLRSSVVQRIQQSHTEPRPPVEAFDPHDYAKTQAAKIQRPRSAIPKAPPAAADFSAAMDSDEEAAIVERLSNVNGSSHGSGPTAPSSNPPPERRRPQSARRPQTASDLAIATFMSGNLPLPLNETFFLTRVEPIPRPLSARPKAAEAATAAVHGISSTDVASARRDADLQVKLEADASKKQFSRSEIAPQGFVIPKRPAVFVVTAHNRGRSL